MGTLNAIYVRANSASIELAVEKFPGAEMEDGEDFTGIILAHDAFEPPHDALRELSADSGTDVIWLSFQSVVDAFEFHHWRGGSLLRSLVFGCYGDEERTWNKVEGQAEPWERAAFFAPNRFSRALKRAKSDDVRRELERIWREGELVPDRQEPRIDARESARAAAEFYKFPGWS